MSRAAWVSARASAATSCAGSLSDHPGQNSHISPSSAIAQSSQRLGSQPSLSRSQKHAVHLHIPSLLLSSRFTLEVCVEGEILRQNIAWCGCAAKYRRSLQEAGNLFIAQ